MSKTQIITLLTDFGLSDVYVGVMKGVIAQINPHLTVIDLTHKIPPQNIAAGRFCLMNAYPYFPPNTVHIAVVDPGVGSNRRSVAIACANGFLVGPDNGLFSGILSHSPPIAAVELTNPEYWRTPEPSMTFHGRDIFAAVGAHLASGVPLARLGAAIAPDTLIELALPAYTLTEGSIEGCIQYIDRFGNLITNIPGSLVRGKRWSAVVGTQGSQPLPVSEALVVPSAFTYAESQPSQAVALIGSDGWVEIAVAGGNAQFMLQLEVGAEVRVIFSEEKNG
ncbi:MAG: S-adenosyl-l-methionine hydroxide adenosyltransferase family protein [Actinomycetota bacterium]